MFTCTVYAHTTHCGFVVCACLSDPRRDTCCMHFIVFQLNDGNVVFVRGDGILRVHNYAGYVKVDGASCRCEWVLTRDSQRGYEMRHGELIMVFKTLLHLYHSKSDTA